MPFDAHTKLTKANIAELPPLCTDGAWGTELAKRGAQPGQMCDVWNTEQPDKVLSVAQGYVDAGAQVILTNTFNSNRIALAKHGIADRAYELSRAGAEISKRAASGRAYVFASIGPCGKMVMMGEIDPTEVSEAAAEQAKAFADGGADAVVIETQSDLVEAEAALQGVLAACDLPVGLSFTFDAGENNDRTMMGVSIPDVYDLAKRYGAGFVGANCGAGIETFVNIARGFAACGTDIPIWVKGNAGKATIDADGRTVYKALPQAYAEAVPELLGAGAKFIGGCCGSSPEHIAAVAATLRSALPVS
jgi:5-methyltetrahydrofolate--homocysteine methyltransferase